MEFSIIKTWAIEKGFSRVGVCSPAAFTLQKETVDLQPTLRERNQLRFSPVSEYPWASALLVLLWPYEQTPDSSDSNLVFVDSYYQASNLAYHAAKELEKKIRDAGHQAQANVPYPAKAAAVRAGLGIIGDHGLLITPEYGTRVVILLLATDALCAKVQEDSPLRECIHCGRCANACPVGAIDHAGMAHPERCLRNYMMEGIVVPEHIRTHMGMKLIGCDICQRICPQQTKCTQDEQDNPVFNLDEFMTTDEAQFKRQVTKLGEVIGKNAARPQRVRAQAALLAGNRGREKDVPVLAAWEKSDFEAVREHARWALEQIEHTTQGLDQNGEKR